MPKQVSTLVAREQPINWTRAAICGVIGALFLMGFIDLFYLFGKTPFCLELFVGSLLMNDPHSTQAWTIGFFANLVLGGLFGTFYGYCFEYVFGKANRRVGLEVGVGHLLVVGIILFPFLGTVHEFMGTGVYSGFGILGSEFGLLTPVLLTVGHLLFGMWMGDFYGPVRAARVRARYFEPGETGVPVQKGGISREEDPEDRVAS